MQTSPNHENEKGIPCPFFTIPLRADKSRAPRVKPKRETEYHVHSVDEYGDGIEVYFYENKAEAMAFATELEATAPGVFVERIGYLDGDRVSEKTIYESGTATDSQ